MSGLAEISECGQYRYALRREWDPSVPKLVFVMLNPSTADAEKDDPTIRKCVGFAKRFGFGGIRVVNLFALRSRNPTAIALHASPIGPKNDEWIRRETEDARDSIIVAWGAHGALFPERVRDVTVLLRRAVRCLSETKDGQPGHPLMLPYGLMPKPWPDRTAV